MKRIFISKLIIFYATEIQDIANAKYRTIQIYL